MARRRRYGSRPSYRRMNRNAKSAIELGGLISWILFGFFKLCYYSIKEVCVALHDIYVWIRNKRFEDKTGINLFRLRETIEHLSPRDFEFFCADVFRDLGYEAHATQESNDDGRDVVATNNEECIYIECKRFHKKSSSYDRESTYVGRDICKKLVASAMAEQVLHTIVITTGEIHKNAYEYMEKLNKNTTCHLEIWDTDELIKQIKKAQKIEGKKRIKVAY